MDNKPAFILKVLILSTLISLLIKYGGPSLSVPATATSALIAVLLPSAVMGLLLWRRLRESIPPGPP